MKHVEEILWINNNTSKYVFQCGILQKSMAVAFLGILNSKIFQASYFKNLNVF